MHRAITLRKLNASVDKRKPLEIRVSDQIQKIADQISQLRLGIGVLIAFGEDTP